MTPLVTVHSYCWGFTEIFLLYKVYKISHLSDVYSQHYHCSFYTVLIFMVIETFKYIMLNMSIACELFMVMNWNVVIQVVCAYWKRFHNEATLAQVCCATNINCIHKTYKTWNFTCTAVHCKQICLVNSAWTDHLSTGFFLKKKTT